MSNYEKYARNISNGKLSYENWNRFYKSYQQSVNILANVQLTLNLVSAVSADELWPESALSNLGNELLEILSYTTKENFDKELVVEKILSYKEKMKNHMECLLSYMDRYKIYQYVMDCTKYCFEDYNYDDYDDEEFAAELINYISDPDQASVRYKAMEVLKALPIRMTKSRFFEWVRDAYSVYKGADAYTLYTFDYMVRSAAMLYAPDNMQEYFPELFEYNEHFKDLDYAHMDAEEFYKENLTLDECIEYLQMHINGCDIFSGVINQLFAFVLTSEFINDKSDSYHTCKVICEYLLSITPGETEDIEEKLIEYLIRLEGIQEDLLDEIEEANGWYQDIVQTSFAIEAPHQTREEIFQAELLGKLLSASFYADFERKKEPKAATEDDIDRYFKAYFEDLEPKLKAMPKLMSRAIMASVIGYMPMTFSNSEDLYQHIYNSLKACSNMPEKMALVERLEDLMDDDDWD